MQVPMTALAEEYESMRESIDAAIHRVLASGRYVLEDELEGFENEFARFIGTRFAVGVGSGSAALTIALRAAGVGPGDEVITAPNTDNPTASAIEHVGASVVFVDTDPKTFNIDPEQVERKITERTRVLLPVHLFGNPADMDAISDIAARNNLMVIEDSALAVGALHRGQMTGTFGLIGCFSLAPSKILGAYGDAGIVVTDDEQIADRVRVLRNYGHAPGIDLDPANLLGGTRWEVRDHGYNSRLDAIQAAVLRVKLESLDGRIDSRRQAAARYDRLLGPLEVSTPVVSPGMEPVYYAYNVMAENRDRVRTALAADRISTRLYYNPPLHLQPAFEHLGHGPGSFPVTEATAARMIALPIFPQIKEDQQNWVASSLERAVGHA
jgi:dTDP-4-amino-4,6-dideoxygalactose transaminase